MLRSFPNKKAVAQFVENTTASLKPNSRLTMSIHPAKSGDFYVLTAIVELSEDTARELEMFSSIMPGNTLTKNIQAG